MKQTLKYIFDRLEEQLKYAETKHSISITLASALTVFSATYLDSSKPLVNALSAISIIFSLVSVLYSFIALSAKHIRFGRTHKSQQENLLYFKHIARFSPEDYLKEIAQSYPLFKGYKTDQFDLDLSKQVVATAKTISAKFLLFNFALTFLILSLFCESAVIILKGVL
ncbi:MAG TPA: hypothetical protein DEV78_02415 [Clostridiales bacterium]|nr:hypothetical protein [Clostridiales bacterium]